MHRHRTITLAIRLMLAAGTVGLIALPAAGRAAEEPKYRGPCALVASKDGKILYVANADAREVAWVELASGKIVRQVAMPAEPTGLALAPDGAQVIVTCAAPKSSVVVLDAASGRLLATIRAGHTAMGPAISPDGARLYVCNRFDNDVSVIDLVAGKEVARVPALREPIAAAVTPDGKTGLVANHLANDDADAYPLAAAITTIDTRTHKTAAVLLRHGSHSVRGLCLSPDGRWAYITHLLSNFALVPSQVDMGWMTNNCVSIIDLKDMKVLNAVGLDAPFAGAGNPWGIACTADGKTICVALAGTHALSVVDGEMLRAATIRRFISPDVVAVSDDLPESTEPRRIKLPGKGPRAVAVVGPRAYVAEYFSDTLAVVDLETKPGAAPGRIALGPEPKLSPQRRGESLFNDATLCYQEWQSCASCHPDGRSDALNWDLMNDGVGNPKNTKSMILAFETPPSMAEGVRANAGEAVRAGMINILFSTRPEHELAAIDEYIKSLRPVPSPRLVDGKPSAAAERGRKLFDSDRVGCGKCHPAPLYTDMKMHNVGSRNRSDYVDRFDTPTLVEVWRTAPYLHDGRYGTIRDLLVKGKHGNGRGWTEVLSQQELDDLVEFVLSL
jgi:YVTN family beta-propeller protein